MSLEIRLKEHFDTDDVFVACKRLVESAFPQCASYSKARNLETLAAEAQIRVRTEPVREFNGRLVVDQAGVSTITLSSFSNPLRKRFTLAHELSHWLLRRHQGSNQKAVKFRGVRTEIPADQEEERLCDLLAAEILMPIEFVRPDVRINGVSLSAVRKLKDRFNVSFRAALRRIAEVADSQFIYLNVVPHRFKNPGSCAEIDEAYHVTPFDGLQRYRGSARLVREYVFEDIARSRSIRIGVRFPSGRFLQDFEVHSNTRPIPNCDLLAIVGRGVKSPVAH